MEWEIEDFEEEFAQGERFYLTGHYIDGIATLRPDRAPNCLVVFQQAPSVFLYSWIQQSPYVLYMRFTPPPEDMEYTVELSPDGENDWIPIGDSDLEWWDLDGSA